MADLTAPPSSSGQLIAILEAAMTHGVDYGVETLTEKSLADIASAWENAGQWRMLVILLWSRRLQARRHDSVVIARAIDFAFRFLGKRFIGMFFDAIGGFYEHRQEDLIWLIELAKESQYASDGRLQAAIFGLSGSHYYDHERYNEIDLIDARQG